MGSFNTGKPEVCAWIKQNFRMGARCLDVGACNGKWAKLLNDYLKMDGIEIYKPYIEKYKPQNLYENFYLGDIREFKYGNKYDLIIFGDVLEHMSVEDAQKVLEYAWDRCQDLIVAVPYMFEQGEKNGNPYEVHIQNDLTWQNVIERYPKLHPLFLTPEYGYYTKGIRA